MFGGPESKMRGYRVYASAVQATGSEPARAYLKSYIVHTHTTAHFECAFVCLCRVFVCLG